MTHCPIVIVFMLTLMVKVRGDDKEDSADCKFWHQLAQNLSSANQKPGGSLSVACNSTCSQLTCNGFVNKLQMLSMNVNFCFGVRLNHCDKPVTMDYYLEVPVFNLSHAGSVAHNDSLEIPGPNVAGQAATIIIVVEMVRVNSSHIIFGIKGQVRVAMGGFYVFPYTEQIFPPTFIDVPPCDDDHPTMAPFMAPATCSPISAGTTAKVTGGPTIKQTVAVKPIVVKSKTYNQSCEIGLEQCSENEMCVVTSRLSKGGVCICASQTSFDINTGLCQPASTAAVVTTGKPTVAQSTGKPTVAQSTGKPTVAQSTGKPTVAQSTGNTKSEGSPKPGVTEAHKSKTTQTAGINMTGVIIGGVFGGLLLIVVAVSIIIFIGRRKRMASYRGRHQLLTDQDDDDATNVVI